MQARKLKQNIIKSNLHSRKPTNNHLRKIVTSNKTEVMSLKAGNTFYKTLRFDCKLRWWLLPAQLRLTGSSWDIQNTAKHRSMFF